MHVRDKKGEMYETRLTWNSPFLSMFIEWRGMPIAYAHLNLQGERAELSDIRVNPSVGTKYSLLRQFLGCVRKRNFQGRGLGSQLLKLVIDEVHLHGVRKIEGTMEGDIDRLTPWYKSFGFTIDEHNHRISLDLKSD